MAKSEIEELKEQIQGLRAVVREYVYMAHVYEDMVEKMSAEVWEAFDRMCRVTERGDNEMNKEMKWFGERSAEEEEEKRQAANREELLDCGPDEHDLALAQGMMFTERELNIIRYMAARQVQSDQMTQAARALQQYGEGSLQEKMWEERYLIAETITAEIAKTLPDHMSRILDAYTTQAVMDVDKREEES